MCYMFTHPAYIGWYVMCGIFMLLGWSPNPAIGPHPTCRAQPFIEVQPTCNPHATLNYMLCAVICCPHTLYVSLIRVPYTCPLYVCILMKNCGWLADLQLTHRPHKAEGCRTAPGPLYRWVPRRGTHRIQKGGLRAAGPQPTREPGPQMPIAHRS